MTDFATNVLYSGDNLNRRYPLNTLLQPILERLMFPAQWNVWCGRSGPPHHDCSG